MHRVGDAAMIFSARGRYSAVGAREAEAGWVGAAAVAEGAAAPRADGPAAAAEPEAEPEEEAAAVLPAVVTAAGCGGGHTNGTSAAAVPAPAPAPADAATAYGHALKPPPGRSPVGAVDRNVRRARSMGVVGFSSVTLPARYSCRLLASSSPYTRRADVSSVMGKLPSHGSDRTYTYRSRTYTVDRHMARGTSTSNRIAM